MKSNGESIRFHHATLPNGLQVVAETNPHVHSVAAAFAVQTGARDEKPQLMGVSHFLEHMAFKGGGGLNSIEINRRFEDLGAEINAFTSQENTVYHCRVLPEYLADAATLLAGLVQPELRDDDFSSERGVILDEIAESEDQPAYVNYDLVMESHFGDHPLGYRVLGTTETIENLPVQSMRDYHKQRYTAGNVLFAVAGNISWDEVKSLAERLCSDWPEGRLTRNCNGLSATASTAVRQRDGYQQYASSLCAGPAAEDELRYAGQLLTVAVGDEVGSRLFWELVDPGKADMADIALHLRDGYGYYISDLSCRPEDTAANLTAIRKVFAEINDKAITEEELQLAKQKTLSRTVLRAEQPMGRMMSLAGNWLKFEKYFSLEDELDALNAVTPATVRELLDQFPLRQTTVTAVGPLDSLNEFSPLV